MTRAADERVEDVLAVIDRWIGYRDYRESAEHSSMAYDTVLRNLTVIGERDEEQQYPITLVARIGSSRRAFEPLLASEGAAPRYQYAPL
jgi:hypothetical protein